MGNEYDSEVTALAAAYAAIKSQPSEAWPRMQEWLTSRLAQDERMEREAKDAARKTGARTNA